PDRAHERVARERGALRSGGATEGARRRDRVPAPRGRGSERRGLHGARGPRGVARADAALLRRRRPRRWSRGAGLRAPRGRSRRSGLLAASSGMKTTLALLALLLLGALAGAPLDLERPSAAAFFMAHFTHLSARHLIFSG